MQIELLARFTAAHRRSVFDYLAGRLRGREAWRRVFAAFDHLDQALLVTDEARHTFRTVYLRVVDDAFADDYRVQSLAESYRKSERGRAG